MKELTHPDNCAISKVRLLHQNCYYYYKHFKKALPELLLETETHSFEYLQG